MRWFGLALGLAFAASTAQAQNFDSHLTLTGAGSTVYGGVYVGPYTADFPGMPNLDIYCVDYLNDVHIGQSWDVHFTSIGSLLADPATNLGRTRWGAYYLANGGTNATWRYQRAAWLATQFALNPKGVGNATWGGIHGAIWDITSPSGYGPGWSVDGTWINNALQADISNFDWNYWYVVTDINTSYPNAVGGKQEYLVYVTPEPATLLLLGTGLLGLAAMVVATRKFA